MLTIGSFLTASAGAASLWLSMAGQVATPTLAEQAQAAFDPIAQDYPALNATVMVAGEIAWEAEGGWQRDAADGVDRDYNVYSVAKMLTALAYARLEQAGELDLDTPVRHIDPGLPSQYEAVTLRDLLAHRAGVRHYTSREDWISFSDRRCETPADALDHFIDAPLSSPADGEIAYSTYGYVLLSHLLVRLTDTDSFDAAMQAVLGDSYLARRDSDDADKATNWVDLGEGPQAIEGLSAECKFGAGGLLASSRDLAAMGQFLAAGEIVDLDTWTDLPGPWAGYAESVDLHYAAHSGGSPGGRSFLIVYVEPQISVALTGNADSENLQALSIELADLFAGFDDEAAED
ncbi:serine hydrolase [uncultured Maricaulis sp.]|uniref:serine hydrolase domain-containing protein n=1 Tax=uncultured Maricaulis sp. TaxID=174710 RepID=UPI00261F24A5|nr:serine hydrolase domain-containing protein [uncultured Maricaulis sp.]